MTPKGPRPQRAGAPRPAARGFYGAATPSARPRLEPALSITDRGRPRTARALLRRVVRAALEHGGVPGMPVSLLLTGDDEIARIHGEHLGTAEPTDVISFAIDGTAEVVVSVETATRCARAHGHARTAEIALYVVHGLLHLCGYDDRTPRARERMRRAERAVLDVLGLAVADVDD